MKQYEGLPNTGSENNLAELSPLQRTERLLQINMAVLVILATSLLAMGQQNIIYAVIAIVASLIAIVVTDIKGYFRLSPDATTFAAVFACVILVVQVIRNAEQSQLLNVANILIYLEIILLFQKKRDRTYWSLIALSLLQVIVAAALNLGLMFGLLLGVYVIAAFSALMLFFVLRETRPFIQHSMMPSGRRSATNRLAASDLTTQGLAGQGSAAENQALRMLNDFDASSWQDELDDDVTRRARVDFWSSMPETTVNQLLNRSFLRRLARMVLTTGVATILIFFALPRFSNTAWKGARQESVATVGFTEEVRLDAIGRILESPEQVMRVEFSDLHGRPYSIDGEPYFRGTVLPEYKGGGVWKQASRNTSTFKRLNTQRSFDLASTVLQNIILQPGSHSVLFNVTPCHYVSGSDTDLQLNIGTGQLTLADHNSRPQGVLRYRLGTTGFRNGWQRDLIPARSTRASRDITQRDVKQGVVRNQNAALSNVADQVIQSNGLQNASAFDKAKALENHFLRSGEYKYSLEINQSRNRNVDPIDDFVVNHKTGHCEYFAGALTLMLRSQGIPARMVVGYKGGEFNAVGNFYIVRQLHAHAWVEAYVPHDEIPTDEIDTAESLPEGAWLRLDPTVDTLDVVMSESRLPIVTTITEFFDYCRVLWDDYVLGLNAARQRQAIYRPLGQAVMKVGRSLFSPTSWRARWANFLELLETLLNRKLFGVPWLAIIAVGCLAMATVLYHRRHWIGRQSQQLLRNIRSAGQRSKQRSDRSLAAFHQLELILKNGFQLERSEQQTPLEYSAAAAARLAEDEQFAPLRDLPRQVAEAFCQVRYGNTPINPDQHHQLLEAIKRLDAAVAMRVAQG